MLEIREWIHAVEKLLDERHGINTSDCADSERLASAWSDGDTPEEFVDHIAEKYDLQSMEEALGGWC